MAAHTDANKGVLKKASSFIRGVKSELKKVNWPNKKQLVNHTTVVLVSCGLMALLIWIFDSIILQLLRLILG
ncbi:preprotein translocase subunit SecE [Thermohalobacter berrensis]|uniref:Protein translocase subunit SecE n=1 Tax=Thermohalobacter berrensis TaxID=99594 RepID=A0A419T055_9FIRM|nr:preprotein translocase subunit SecE [Thermohalobacter berrensis]RKD30934.1 preprotein translocase subunit SecE [Thermohalobacter berrensis]